MIIFKSKRIKTLEARLEYLEGRIDAVEREYIQCRNACARKQPRSFWAKLFRREK